MKKSVQAISWSARILGILMILFVSMFALDSFAPNLSVWEQIGGFLIHLIPSYILLAALLVAWKWENLGGWLFTLLGIIFSLAIFFFNINNNNFSTGQSLINTMMIGVPFIIVGILFLVSHQNKKAPTH